MTSDNKQLLFELKDIVGSINVRADEPMSLHTSFRTGGPADYFVKVDTPGKLVEALKTLRRAGVPDWLVGRGTNLLVGDGGVRGCIITMTGGSLPVTDTAGERSADTREDIPLSLGDLRSILVEGNVLTAGAGSTLAAVAAAARDAALSGLEFAAGIPGSVGGGLVMNAGAYGGEMKQVVRSVTVLDDKGEIRKISAEEMSFGYRRSVLKERPWIALSCEMALTPGDPEKILSQMQSLAEKRRLKQPLEYPSAGSTFKRPEGYFAGQLIEEAGLRGFSLGGAAVSEKHCGFVINKDHATSSDIRDLIEKVQERVLENSGVQLEREVIYLGDF